MRVMEYQDSAPRYEKQEGIQMNSEIGIKKPKRAQASRLFETIRSRDTNV